LDEAKRINADLLVVGASHRFGEELYLGQTMNRILQKWKSAIILVAT
jgi:nucleotide-binding universal stress UspA family protein